MAVTKYMAIKWVKAAFEIVAAIVFFIGGNRIFFGVFPEEAQEKAVFGLLVALLWFLIIWCIIAAVRNIILSLRPEPKDSLQTLNVKIDALEKQLVTMGLASEAVPVEIPPSPQEIKKRKNKKIMVAAGIVAAMVILAAITAVFLMTKMGGGGNPAGGATPEDTLNALITAMNARDANGVLSLTVYSFGNATMKDQYRQGLNEVFNQAGSSFHVTMNSHQIKYPADLNASESSNLTAIQNDIQNHISNTVTASCIIVFNMTITVNQSSFFQSGNMPCFQIDGGWYILLDIGGGGPDDGGGDRQSPEQTFLGFIENLNLKDASGAVSFTVAMFGDDMEQSQTRDGISTMWWNSSSFNVVVDSYQVRYWPSLNMTEQNNISSIQGNVSSHYGVSVQDSCFVQYMITITNDSGPRQMTGNMACFKIDEQWYLKLEEHGDGQPDYTITISWNHPGAFYILNVDSITGAGSSINTNDVYLTVTYANASVALDHVQLSMMPVGSSINGTEYVEIFGLGTLDAGDSFSLDDTMFGMGTVFTLENAAETQEYCHISI